VRRVLLINHTAELGGAEYGLLDLARHYGPARCHVVLFADGPLRQRLAAAGIGVTLLAGGRTLLGVRREAGWLRALAAVPAVLAMAWRLARLVRDGDVLYVNSQKAAVVGLLAGPLRRRPVVWHLHDILSPAHFAALQRWAVVWLANRATRRVIAISEATKQSFLDCGGDPGRVVVVPNGVDATRFAGLEVVDVAAMRARLGLAAGPLLGLFGRISPWKGQHVLIAALAELPGVQALIVGDALFEETAYKRDLLREAERRGVAGRIHWLGYRRDTPQLMRMVDLVLHTSTAPEPFGRVIVEAVLAGRPVLASDHGAARELLGEESGWLVTPADPAALAQAIRRLLAAPPAEVADELAVARARALERFTLPQMMQGIAREVALVTRFGW
jgi:glycosyltransferase involved in cell wall biosynthesis